VATEGLTLEIVEGPGAGRQIPLDRPVVVGRASDTDLVLEDGQVSRHHARITPESASTARVEDLGSANGTFLNHNELYGPALLDAGDQLLIGVTLIQLRSHQQVVSQPSAVIAVPPALATAPRTPAYINPEVLRAETDAAPARTAQPALDRYLDVRVRRRAQLAPVALFTLVALALIVYFALR
jgi:pSer/pThr/pTyr-binding forkhead associated (FHA) protein